MPLSDSEKISRIQDHLPSEAKAAEVDGGYGWDATYIQSLLDTYAFASPQAVRFFWLQRVNESVEYIDIGKPLTQIHKQARDMLAYWDAIIQANIKNGTPENMENTGEVETARVPLSFGEIERPWS